MAVGADALTTRASLKAHLKVTSTTDDALMDTLIDQATNIIETFCDRKFKERTYTEFYNGDGEDFLQLEQYPITSVTSFNVDANRDFGSSTLLTEDTDFVVKKEEGSIDLISDVTPFGQGQLPVARKAIKVVYVAGYATIPDDLVYAANETAAHLFNNRGSTRNVNSRGIGGFSESFGKDNPVEIPGNVKAILNGKYRKAVLAESELVSTSETGP